MQTSYQSRFKSLRTNQSSFKIFSDLDMAQAKPRALLTKTLNSSSKNLDPKHVESQVKMVPSHLVFSPKFEKDFEKLSKSIRSNSGSNFKQRKSSKSKEIENGDIEFRPNANSRFSSEKKLKEIKPKKCDEPYLPNSHKKVSKKIELCVSDVNELFKSNTKDLKNEEINRRCTLNEDLNERFSQNEDVNRKYLQDEEVPNHFSVKKSDVASDCPESKTISSYFVKSDYKRKTSTHQFRKPLSEPKFETNLKPIRPSYTKSIICDRSIKVEKWVVLNEELAEQNEEDDESPQEIFDRIDSLLT